MQPIDWGEVAALTVAAVAGGFFVYYVTRSSPPDPKLATWSPARGAALTALGAFLGAALADDCLTWLKGERAGGYFMFKYALAVGVWITQYAFLARNKRQLARQGR
jgi:hypothetical protein